MVSEDEGKPSQQRTQQLRANVKYGSPSKVLCSPFVLGQVAFNALSSVGCSVLLFYFLFVVLVVPPGDPLLVYHWTDPNLVGVVIGSALVVSPTLVMILAPAGMPEAVRNANVARVLDTHWAFLLALLSLASSPHSCARIPMLRRSTRAGFASFGYQIARRGCYAWRHSSARMFDGDVASCVMPRLGSYSRQRSSPSRC